MARHREFDVAELSMSSYTVSLHRDPQPFIAIPVFVSRYFRHSSIFVSAKSGIREPKDLVGKRIGTPEYQMTAPVWIRGILADDYGVKPDSVEYWTGGEETTRREEKIRLDLPSQLQGAADRAGPDALADDRRGRDRRAAHRARAFDLLFAARRGEAPVSGLRGGRAGLLPAHEDFPDHARRGDPPRAVRSEPLDRDVALQGVRRGAAARLREPARNGRAQGDAAVARGAASRTPCASWARTGGPTGSTATGTCSTRSCAITTSRGCRSAGSQPEDMFAPETLEAFKI